MIKLFKFLWNDLKTDILFLISLIKGEAKINEKTKLIVKEFQKEKAKGNLMTDFLKDNWFWILFAVLTFCIGLWLGSLYFENKCNSVLVKAIEECNNYYQASTPSIFY